MRTGTASTEFEARYRAHYPALMRLGYLLTGSNVAGRPGPASDGVRYRPPT